MSTTAPRRTSHQAEPPTRHQATDNALTPLDQILILVVFVIGAVILGAGVLVAMGSIRL